jgi:hypothetical protein
MGSNAPRDVVLAHGGFVDGSGWQRGFADALAETQAWPSYRARTRLA